ncbi:MAG: hypothetical protein GKS06_07695 [Acidobacteria bacterium]|nr:hypothetical protein [Acidobacteriota bacterium]
MDLAQALVRLIGYLGVFALVGATGLGARLCSDLGAASERMRDRALHVAIFAALVLIATALITLLNQTSMFFGDDEGVNAETIRTIAMETGWGAGWRVQFGAATFALMGALLIRSRRMFGWPVLGVGAIAAAAAQSLTGHAFEGSWLSVKVLAQAIHVVAGSLWIGSLLVIVVAVMRHESDDDTIATVVDRFSPIAVISVAALAASGALSSYFNLASPVDLISTAYGRVLLAKILAFGATGALGFTNWRKIRPHLGTKPGTARLRRVAAVELAFALAVLVLTTYLVVLPLPAWGI